MNIDDDKLAALPTERLKFILGVGKAGLDIWPKNSPKMREIRQGLEVIEGELARRGVKA